MGRGSNTHALSAEREMGQLSVVVKKTEIFGCMENEHAEQGTIWSEARLRVMETTTTKLVMMLSLFRSLPAKLMESLIAQRRRLQSDRRIKI